MDVWCIELSFTLCLPIYNNYLIYMNGWSIWFSWCFHRTIPMDPSWAEKCWIILICCTQKPRSHGLSFLWTYDPQMSRYRKKIPCVPGSINSLDWGETHPIFNDGNPFWWVYKNHLLWGWVSHPLLYGYIGSWSTRSHTCFKARPFWGWRMDMMDFRIPQWDFPGSFFVLGLLGSWATFFYIFFLNLYT